MNNIIRPLLLVCICILALYIGFQFGRAPQKTFSINSSLSNDKLSTIIRYIEKKYVDPVNTDSLVELLIPELLLELDPHSVYIPARDYSQMNESLEGNFDGIGVSFSMLNDTVIVGNVIKKGPSFQAKVYPGDRIIKVNDSLIAGRKIKQDSIMKLLRGKSGSLVKIGVKRSGVNDLIDIKITRGKIPIPSVDVAYLIKPKIAYIKISQFGRSTHSEFINALKAVRKEGASKLIIDLRDNTGGYLDQAFEMANEFIPKDKLIVYTEGKASPRQEMRSKGNGSCLDDQVIILIDEASASASEILAGALQDNDRGTIIGRRSFGKGLVQEPVEFRDNSGMRLTIARYYTPSGRCIQRPYNHGSDTYYHEIMRRYENGEMVSADSIHQSDTTKYYTGNGRVVFGGGGITPDIFVPIDTSSSSTYLRNLRKENVLFYFALAYSDKHRKELINIQTTEELDLFYQKNPPMVGLDEFATKRGVRKEGAKQSPQAYALIETHVKALIGQATPLDDLGASYFFNKIDSTVLHAMQTLEHS